MDVSEYLQVPVVGKLLSQLTLTPKERECSSVAGVILIFIGGETEA